MRFIRKNGDEDEYNDDDMDGFMDEGDYESLISQQNALEGFHLHILEKNLKTKILFESVKFCEKSIFWRFFSQEWKLNQIKRFYEEFIDLLDMKE
jgi:hypothetical protein